MEILLGAFATDWQQRKAAFLHDLSLGCVAPEDEEPRRWGGVAATPKAIAKSNMVGLRSGRGHSNGIGVRRRADRPMHARFVGLASGSQPAVVKLASFGGGARMGAMINYVSRNGAIVVENERGELLQGRDQIAAVSNEWDHLLKNRTESRDIGLFNIAVEDDQRGDGALFDRARAIVKHALGERAFAIAVKERPDGRGFDIDGVAVLRDQSGERLTADAKASDIVQRRLGEGQGGAVAKFQFTGYGNGIDYGASRLRSVVETHAGSVHDNEGRPIEDGKAAGDLVQLTWRHQLHSRKPRDVMHLILSARAGTDAGAFQNAARQFLASQFSHHRYVFSLHDISTDPKAEEEGGKRPHIHIHAIVAMRSDGAERIVTTISTFREWRINLAEKARANGIEMEMSDRRDRASPAGYGRNHVRPVNMIGRTEHEGTSKAAQHRYEAKRRDNPAFAATEAARTYQAAAKRVWREISDGRRSSAAVSFAETQALRLQGARAPGQSAAVGFGDGTKLPSQLRTHMVKLRNIFSEADDMRHMARTEFEAYEKRVETALFQAERSMPPQGRRDFEQIAQAARDHVNVRRELLEMTEQRAAHDRAGVRSSGQDRLDDQPQSQTKSQSDSLWHRGFEDHEPAITSAATPGLRDAAQREAEIGKDPGQARTERTKIHPTSSRTSDLGITSNTVNRKAAEIDVELKNALQARHRVRHGEEKGPPDSTDAHQYPADQHSIPNDTRGNGSGEGQSGQEDKEALRPARDRTTSDKTRGDPAKQHIPRLEKLQRPADEHQKDDNDQER